MAAKLERHLRKNGIPCRDADIIIEETSVIYVEKLKTGNKVFKLLKKINSEHVFVESACRALERYVPEARATFASQKEIAKCLA